MTTTRAGRADHDRRDEAETPSAVGGSAARAGRTGSSAGFRYPRDWEWRRKIRSNPRSLRIYRLVVGTLGLVITATGLVMVPFPGPGWVVVFVGVSIWASEFAWAKRLHNYGIGKLREWNAWVQQKGFLVKASLFVATCVFVNAFVWTFLKLTGIPAWVPEQVSSLMTTYLAL